MLTRRAFLAGCALAGATGSWGLFGCSRSGINEADAESQAQGDGQSAIGSNDSALSGEESGSSLDGVRELIEGEPGAQSVRRLDNSHVSPDPSTVQGSVLTAAVTPFEQQRLFLWEEGRVPAVTTSAAGGEDPADFRPTITSYPVDRNAQVKGALLLCAGGAFMARVDNADAIPSAQALAELGYQCFVVDYRLRPYSQQEGGVDLARAIRFVRAHASEFGLPDERCIALAGFSAGGIQCGETLINWSGNVTPDALDSSYRPDDLDAMSADAAADAMVYSFYGRLSVASRDADLLRNASLPPTFYCYGTEDPFYDQFEMQVGLMNDLGYTVHARVLGDWPHGFGALGGWVPRFDEFMQAAFERE